MIGKIKKIIRKLMPKFVLSSYHWLFAILAKLIYFNPSNKLVVIGVIGTNGKSTTVNLIGRILEFSGHKVGWTTTVNFKVGDKERLNDKKMTMLGRLALQKLIKQMIGEGCEYAVIETSSEGIKQYRHLGLNYDAVVFTNLTPEHIESHGSFANYKRAKGELFRHTGSGRHKKIRGKAQEKIAVVNLDSEYAGYFASFKADKKIGFGTHSLNHEIIKALNQNYNPTEVKLKSDGSEFILNGVNFTSNLVGQFNVENCLAAIATVTQFGISLEECREALVQIPGVPGRMESILAGQNFQIIVDYAPEVESMKQLYKFIREHGQVSGKIIHVLGSCGGGRDRARRPVLGQMAAENADVIIVTNEDPYNEDPKRIIGAVVEGAMGKYFNFQIADFQTNSKFQILNSKKELWAILDRREAITKALSLAEENDLVLITGKGAEQYMCVANGKKLKWDDRQVVREELAKIE